MKRVQVQLADGELSALRAEADREGQSISAYLRDAAVQRMERTDRRRRMAAALEVIGIGRSGLSDLAENHDEYFVEAVESTFDR